MNAPLQPLPAEPPISGPFWTLVLPALLFACSLLATWLLYRRFARVGADEDRGEAPRR
jgi:hypothetical protein